MSRIFPSTANAPVPASRNSSTITRGKLRSRRGYSTKQKNVQLPDGYLEEEDGSPSHDTSVIISSQSVGCEIVWDCLSPTQAISSNAGDGSSTPGEGTAPRRLRKRSLTHRTPARPLHLSAGKAKKAAGFDVKPDAAVSGAKCAARLLFFKNAVPSHEKDVSPASGDQDEVEAMDIMDLSPIACLSGVEAAVAAADETAAAGAAAQADAAPGSPQSAVAPSNVTPPTTPKMNQSFSCKNSANRGRSSVQVDSFDDDSLFSESIIQSTQAIEEALFDKSNNRFVSPAAVSKALSKIQPDASKVRVSDMKQCNTPLSHRDNYYKGVKCRTAGVSSSLTRDLINPSNHKDSTITVDNSSKPNTRLRKGNDEIDKFKLGASHLLSKPLASNGSKDSSGLVPNSGNNNASSINKRAQSVCSSGYKSGSSIGGDPIRTDPTISNKQTSVPNLTSTRRSVIGGAAIADKPSTTKVPTSAWGRNGQNQSKMPRSRSVYSGPGGESTALVAMTTTAVRRVNSDSAVLNFSDSDPEFDEIASSIPDDEEMLKPWSQQMLERTTRLRLNSNKEMQQQLSSIQEVLNKSLQRSGSSEMTSDCLQQPKNTVTKSTGQGSTRDSTNAKLRYSGKESVSMPTTNAVMDDADFFDDTFEMEDVELNNFLSQVEEEYVSASQAAPTVDHRKTNSSAGQQLTKLKSADKASVFGDGRNYSSSTLDHRKHVDVNIAAKGNNPGIFMPTNNMKHSSASEPPFNRVTTSSNKPETNLNIIRPSQIASLSRNKYESTPNKKYYFRKQSSRKDSVEIAAKDLVDIGPTKVGPTPLSNKSKAQRTITNSTDSNHGSGVGYIRPPSTSTTQSAIMNQTSRSLSSGAAATVHGSLSAPPSSKINVAVTSQVASSSNSSQFSGPIPTTTGSGPAFVASGNKTRYTKDQIAMKRAQAIERQKALLQRKAKGGAV